MNERHEIPNSTPAAESTAGQLESIIRRDLKLGSDITIEGDTVLFGGDLDLDSLDALLLVQSIEKEFDVKIPSDAINPEVFRNLDTLARFVEEVRNGGE
jgi:acyl carrier protein